jgi:hypothetical protein
MDIKKTGKSEYTVTGEGFELRVKKDPYNWLWNIWPASRFGVKWAGPFATKREAVEEIEAYYDDKVSA